MGFLKAYQFNKLIFIKKFSTSIRRATKIANKGEFLKEEIGIKKSVSINKELINKLEKVSLVGYDIKDGIQKLEEAINFAEKLLEVPLDPNIKPMYTVLENESLRLRDDVVCDGDCRTEILKNAAKTEEEYFVAPIGNAPSKI